MASVASHRRNSQPADTITWSHRPCTVPDAAARGRACQRTTGAPQPHRKRPDSTAAANTINVPEEPVTPSDVDQCSCMALHRACPCAALERQV